MDLNEKCAVFGVYGTGLDVSRLSFFGLFALQHRGQESSGIATTDGEKIYCHKGMGLVPQVFNEEIIKSLPGYIAVGHNRYSTSKGSIFKYAQPVEEKDFVLVHNGNLPSVKALQDLLKSDADVDEKCSDSILMAKSVQHFVDLGMNLPDAVEKAYPFWTGAFSVLIMGKRELIAVRDYSGMRPFAMGTLNGAYVFASETCAFSGMEAKFLKAVPQGGMIVVDEKGVREKQLREAVPKLDVFEFVYFSRPDSTLLGQSVNEVRRRFGEELAKEFHPDVDVVVPVPETAIPVAIGYSQKSGIPFDMALVKNRYIHRTFIQPEQHLRDAGVKMKLVPLPQALSGKRVIVMDDSIVRGTTSRQIVKAIFEAGAKEVHFVVSSPPIRYPDFYGIDTPLQKDLIAANKTKEQIREYLGATSLHYLSYSGMIKAVGVPEELLSTSCFTGIYPIDIHERAKDITKLDEMI